MAKLAPTPVVKKDSKKNSTKKNTKVGNSKKSAPARSTMITSREDLANMTSAELKGSLNKIDFDKAVDYKAEDYIRKSDKKLTEAYYLETPDKKEHFIGETLAVALGKAAEADPLGFSLKFIAYLRGNPYLAK